MIPIIKNANDIKGIKKSCKIAAKIIKHLYHELDVGVNVYNIELLSIRLCRMYNSTPAFMDYSGYKFSTCISVNEEVVHGIPCDRVLNSGDVVSIDFGVIHEGWYSDVAFTKVIGLGKNIDVIDVCKKGLLCGINSCEEGKRIGDISSSIQEIVEYSGFNVFKDLVGHGIGKKLHEKPQVPNYGNHNTGIMLKRGMVIAIEPIISGGSTDTYTKENGWTIATVDSCISAHFEHTVVVLSDGVEILTYFDT